MANDLNTHSPIFIFGMETDTHHWWLLSCDWEQWPRNSVSRA